jgi:hypothetical protein
VRTWRRLQQLGAIAVKQAVWVLPDSPAAREDFEWLKAEIQGAGGEATVFAASSVDTWSNDALVEEFRRLRQDAYEELARDAEKILRKLPARGHRRTRVPAGRVIQQLRERLAAIEQVDFFRSAGRDRVATLVKQIEERATGRRHAATTRGSAATAGSYKARLWVTRPRPGVDRMASAWLIRRFVDREARFGFVADRDAAPRDSVPFDMFGVEFTHRGDLCTFEVLCGTFDLRQDALTRIAGIVHDLDLKDEQFGAPETPAVGMIIDGLRLADADDQALLADGMTLFEALYRALSEVTRPRGPRPMAKRHPGRQRLRRR